MGLFDLFKMKKVKLVDTNSLQSGIRHNYKFPEEIIEVIKDIKTTFNEVYPITMDVWIERFDRDSNPEREIALWSYMADVYEKSINKCPNTLDYHKEIFKIILACSLGDDKYVLSQVKVNNLSASDVKAILKEFRKK